MSKQLALSIAFSVMAMSSFVLFGVDAASTLDGASAQYRLEPQAADHVEPGLVSALVQFQPVIR